MDWQSLTKEECIKELNTDSRKGLSARQVQKNSIEYGKNELTQKRKTSLFRRFLAQFSDFMVIILLIAAAISFVTSYIKKDNDYIDSIIILIIVIINAVIGLVQESRAEKAIEALKKLASPQAEVMRSGRRVVVDSVKLVPGDLTLLNTGDLVPADMRLLESHNLKAEESALTGESLPTEKNAELTFSASTPLGDRRNMLFCGSSISEGRGIGIVVATAMNTQVGKIAHMINAEESPQTPLQRKLAQTGKFLGTGALLICLIIFIMGLFQKVNPLEMFMISISLAVAAIPEGLPAVVTIVLAIGMRRMAAKRAIVRRMPAVETLGSASVICSDKTGTLTQNRMTVVELADLDGKPALSSAQGEMMLNLASLCNNCTIVNGKAYGGPTEAAFLMAASKTKEELEKHFPRIGEIPFNSNRKMMTTIHKMGTNQYRIITKGAPDLLLNICSFCLSNYAAIPLTPSQRNIILHKNEEMASRALRVLGVAYRDVSAVPKNNERIESELTFCGLIGMIDPPRPQAADAVRQCKKAGIRPVMITGDHIATATAIAKQIGIIGSSDSAMTGAQLDKTDQKELERKIYQYVVFARVSPEHKVRIVKAFQAHGEVVAMTGDGVNDAPALKAADIGCAMGISGTDVAKAASDMILTDDNFATIVSAVREGRGIYENIKKTIHFLISCNIGEILTVFVAFLLRLPTPLLAIQLLWVNLVTDSLPALALGVEPIENDIMQRRPAKQNESVFAGGMGYNILVEGCLIGSLALLAYTIGRIFFDIDKTLPIIGRTMAFAVLSLSQVVHTFNMRSPHSIFKTGVFKNPKLLFAALTCIVLQTSVIVIAPLSRIFKTAPLDLKQWWIVILLSLVPLLVVETEKIIFNKIRNK